MLNKAKSEHFTWQQQPALSLCLFVFLILLIRIFLRSQMLELDEAEQVVMAQHLSPGYPDQPPLYSWLQYTFFQLFGCNLLSLALLKSFLLFACLYCFHQVCRLHCESTKLAWCATLSWALIPAISFDLIKDNTHSILALFSACLTWYWVIAPSRLSKAVWSVNLGFIIGLGFLSKFNYVLFLGILLLSCMTITEYRKKIVNPFLILIVLVSFLIASPYIFWLHHHLGLGFRSAYKLVHEDQQQWYGLAVLIGASFLFIFPTFIAAKLCFPIKFKFTESSGPNALLMRYQLISLPFLILILVGLGISNFEARWLIPILFLSPLLFFGQVIDKGNLANRVKFFVAICLFVQLSIFIALQHRSHDDNKIRNQLSLNQIIQHIKGEQKTTANIVSDSHWILGNLMLHFPGSKGWLLHPANEPILPIGQSLLIWQNATPPFWIDHFAKTQHLEKIKFVEDEKRHKVIAGYSFVTVTRGH